MAEISQIVIPGGNTYDIKDTKARFYGECTTAPGTAAKAVTITGFTSADLTPGITIRVRFSNANTATAPTLNINNLGARSIYRYGTTAPSTSATTSWHAGSIVALTYYGTGWILNGWLNDATSSSDLSNLLQTNRYFTANSAIWRYQLLFHVDPDRLTPLNNISNGYSDTTKPILTDVEFDPYGEIYYYASTTSIASNSSGLFSDLYYAYDVVDLRYSLNISSSVNPLTAYKDVYMKVAPQSSGKVKLAAAFPLVQTLPTTNDGYWYILLGRSRDAYTLSLYPHHEIYMHNGTNVQAVLPQSAIASSTTAGLMSASDKTTLDGLVQSNITKKIVSITIPAGSTLYVYNDSWVTAGTACFSHNLGMIGLLTFVSWEIDDGKVTFQLGYARSSSTTFTFGMIK